ncbi:TOBE domain-containing protein [Sulfurospirillum multivorans]|uniref:Molybdenum transporter regulator ModE n=2 Tax=Sulfurospirillum multivorans TaxID=66821 RepID=A0AA86AQ92_SULMK|nr:TOBE domain-containing protein [Sulfurospirillum multivorans]AHJ13663.1 molybdenum transporter regulator ModE [Sulfurospirillum multivorans DSM 12446]QEH07153.1 molybdenum transporter regulator ModE [Sulfurospirillum multivorans]
MEGITSGVMSFDKPALLEKRIRLLEAIAETGSISSAAKRVGLSYKATWEAVDTMNNLSNHPLVTRVTGGSGGGGTTLTPLGIEVIANYSVLKKEYERFLNRLSTVGDFEMNSLKHIQRIAMQISARNQLMGKIGEIKQAKVNAEVSIVLKSGVILVSTITNSAVEELGLEIGDEVVGIIKASSVLISNVLDIATSARNKLAGVITDIKIGEVNAQVSIDIGQNDVVVSTITSESVRALSLGVGSRVCAIIKSSSILIGK